MAMTDSRFPVLVASLVTMVLSGCLPLDQEPAASPTSAPPAAVVPSDTRLVSNPNTAGLDLSPFQTHRITVTAPIEYQNEARLFLKIQAAQDTLFLGEVVMAFDGERLHFQLPITVAADVISIQFQIFGASGLLPVFMGEVML